jgi:NADH-quinone oxidoreductase subunit F
MSEKILSRNWGRENSHTIEVYRRHGGYKAIYKALREMKARDIVEEVTASNLRGCGGAGFPTGQKWKFLPPPDGKSRYLVVNADEGEPGTFKDRFIMELDPHMLIEGIVITGYATMADHCFIYIRGEYVEVKKRILEALEEAKAEGYLGDDILGSGYSLRVSIVSGAGAYICGEEMALLESIASVGLFGRPTVVNNVETISFLPHIVERGGKWFAELGTPGNGGTKLYAVSGHVEQPGVVELPMGTPLGEVIDACGGVRGGNRLKAVIPGGVSSAVLPADAVETRMDFTSLQEAGSMLGSAAVIVMDEDTDMVKVLGVITAFFDNESCGQCTPCREGTTWSHRVVQRILDGRGRPEDIEDLLGIAANMDGTTICPLAAGAAMAIKSFLTRFRREFDDRVTGGAGGRTAERTA